MRAMLEVILVMIILLMIVIIIIIIIIIITEVVIVFVNEMMTMTISSEKDFCFQDAAWLPSRRSSK